MRISAAYYQTQDIINDTHTYEYQYILGFTPGIKEEAGQNQKQVSEPFPAQKNQGYSEGKKKKQKHR